VIILLVIAAGLASRSSAADYLPSFVGEYAGDTLWALTVYLVLGFVFPGIRRSVAVALTIAISFGVEFSQLYQAEWINTIRETRIGALALGAGFLWSDLVCYTAGYTVGCVLGLVGETVGGMTAEGVRAGKTSAGDS
jgi:hypothetical protein